MRFNTRWILLPGVVFLLASCHDAPTGPAHGVVVGDAVLAKGGNGNGKDKGGGGEPSGDLAALGAALFADEALSLEGNQSCQTCHHPDLGFAGSVDPAFEVRGSVVQGSRRTHDAFGDRKPPTAAYATLVPEFAASGNNASGGLFWDGRATGDVLGSPAADQALGPFLNPKEQSLPEAACVIWKVAGDPSAYSGVWPADGPDIWHVDWANASNVCASLDPPNRVGLDDTNRAIIEEAYALVGRAVAAHETGFNAFSSRFDLAALTPAEERGQKIFGSNAKCQQCHDNKGSQPLFTDHEFHNLGVPANPVNPVYPNGEWAFDPGLGRVTGNAAHLGKFRTPTTRNVAVGEAGRTYMHNGSLPTLWQVVQFYNTRDVLPTCTEGLYDDADDMARWGPVTDHPDAPAVDFYGCWPPPEHGENLDTKNMGNLGLTDDEVAEVVAYLRAMSDEGLGGS